MAELRWTSKSSCELVGDCTVHEVGALHRSMCDLVGGEKAPAELSLAGLTAIDTAGAQLLVAFRRRLGRNRCVFTSCPRTAAERISALGLERELFGGGS